jgi:HAE1 family hydrophobic/amphiphilic exporter-1
MSLGGIALSIGMLIDNSVVILEAIARRREAGLAPAAAARAGTQEVAMAVTAATLTTVAVFLPLVFVSGIAGQLFRDQALTVTFAQLLSLLASLTLVPMLAAWFGDRAGYPLRDSADAASTHRAQKRALWSASRARVGRALTTDSRWLRPLATLRALLATLGALFGWLLAPWVAWTQNGYQALAARYPQWLRTSLQHRGRVLAFGALGLLATVALLPRLQTELLPQLSQGEFSVRVKLPAGTPLSATDAQLRQIAARAAQMPQLQRAYAVAGTGNRLDASPVDAGENVGEIAFTMQTGAGTESEAATIASLRRELAGIPGLQYELRRPALFTLATPVEIVLSTHDLERLNSAAQIVKARLLAEPLFADVRSSIEGGQPEIQIIFDQDRATQLGLRVRDIADRVVSSVRGDVATRYRWRDRKIDVLVRSVDARDASIEAVRSLIVNPGAERPVTLDAVADVRRAIGPAEIRRAGQERVALLSASVGAGDLGRATAAAQRIVREVELPAGVLASVTGQSEDMAQSFRSLLFAFALAVLLVYLVMASQFESLRHPFVILFTIPMGLIGAVWALLLTGLTLNAVAFIGLILLAGIVVNNAIVLVDAINQARERGAARLEAIVLAGATRLRPILITSVSTILGLLPMAIGFGDGAEIRRPMAVTIIGGMLIATFMTLIVIPVLYDLLDRKATPAANAIVEASAS